MTEASPSFSDISKVTQTTQGDRTQTVGTLSGGSAIANIKGEKIIIDNRTNDPAMVKQIVQDELLHQKYGQSVGQGLSALAELMQIATVKSSVITYRVVFESTCAQIKTIANYKALHDVLHALEFQCYSMIVQAARRFPGDELVLEDLLIHELKLQSLIGDLKEITATETLATFDVHWLNELQSARTELNKAVDNQDTDALKRTIWLLNRVLAIQPDRINTYLTAAAQALQLPELVQAMELIEEKLQETPLDPKKRQQFGQGVTVLAKLDQRLSALVIAHDCWQTFDSEMRRIESSLSHDLIELEMSWPYLQQQASELLESDSAPWAVSFQADGQRLNDAIARQHPVEVKRYFRLYRRRASERFFKVDVTLKSLCEELREVGGPLSSVLRMMT